MTKMETIIHHEEIMRREGSDLVGKLYDPLLDKLPENTTPAFQKMINNWHARFSYIGKFGFVPLTKNVITEIVDICTDLKINNFIEIEAGTGFLTKCLNDTKKIQGKGYSLAIPEEATPSKSTDGIKKPKNHWGLQANKIYRHNVENNLLELIDIRDLKIKIPEMVISSWIPLNGGEEVIEFFENNSLPDYYMVIGEGCGGCTANDNFHNWLSDYYVEHKVVNSYTPFTGIYDSIIIFRRRTI